MRGGVQALLTTAVLVAGTACGAIPVLQLRDGRFGQEEATIWTRRSAP